MKLLLSNILLLLLSVMTFAQEKADTTVRRYQYLPSGVRIGTDMISIARNVYDKSFKGWELNADTDFDRYFLALDIGQWGRDFTTDTETYSSDGRYFRIGVDVNFLKKDIEKNMFFIGGRYGRTTFSETLNISTVDPLWGPITRNEENSNVKGRWLELTTGIRVRMWKMIWMGYTARFKFGLSTKEGGAMLPSDVPGYGNTDKESTWGFNYQIFVRIPYRKVTPALEPAKK